MQLPSSKIPSENESKDDQEGNLGRAMLQSFPSRAVSTDTTIENDECKIEDYTEETHQRRTTLPASDDEQLEWYKRRQKWVVLVDDEAPIRKAVGRLLFEKGYQVTTCPDAFTTLQVLSGQQQQRPLPQGATFDSKSRETFGNLNYESNSTVSWPRPMQQPLIRLPDVIVSDIRMPEMDGLELLREIRTNPALVHVPVVLLTAKGQIQDRIEGYDAGADAYLSKPFDPEELVTIVDSVIERHETLNDNQQVGMADLRRDLMEIKRLLLETGGGGLGAGTLGRKDNDPNNVWVEQTNVFLAPDERQVLELLCEGLTNKEISERIFVSTRRVEQILTAMFRKVGVRNRTELVRWAISTGNVQI